MNSTTDRTAETNRTHRVTLRDRARIEYAVMRYSWWLDIRGARWRRRVVLRRELRANLMAAAQSNGIDEALFGIGSPKQLAYDTVPSDANRPTWSTGAIWAATVFGISILAIEFQGFTVVDTLRAAQLSGPVTVELFPWFGTKVTAVTSDSQISTEWSGFPWPVVLGAITFVIASRPWRLLGRARRASN